MIRQFQLGTLALALVASAGFAFYAQQPAQEVPAPAPINVGGLPEWLASEDIGNGVELEAWVGTTDTVLIQSTNTSVRAVNMHLNFRYGMGVMQQIDSIELIPLTDSSPRTFQMAGLDRNVIASQRPPHSILNYTVTVTPKATYTWGTIRGAIDLDFSAVQF
jgi:hypothetical protein